MSMKQLKKNNNNTVVSNGDAQIWTYMETIEWKQK